jgi:hypothetical protein
MNVMKTTVRKTVWGAVIPGTLFNITAGGLIAIGASVACLSNTCKLAAMASYEGLSSQNQDATSLIVKDIRRANSLEHASQDKVVLRCGSPGHISLITYTYDAAAHILTRTDSRSTQTVLTDLDGFSFSFFQRPSLGASFNSFAPATASTAKMVSCRWSCSRKVAGDRVDTESVELAPIVMRNHC